MKSLRNTSKSSLHGIVRQYFLLRLVFGKSLPQENYFTIQGSARSVVNPDCLKPLNCKGLFTTTHANTHRPLIKPMVMAGGEHHVACSTAPIECEFDRLPDRNPRSGLIGIGLISGLRSLSLLGTKISISQPKVVPKSVVNPDCLKPLNCKGLFTTTHANTHRPLIKPMVMASGEHHAACSTLSIECEFDRLPDRNPGSGLIGIGLVSVLRTLL